MVPVLNPSNELKEKALARIPKACRNTFYRVNPDGGSEKVESVFDLKKGDKFFIEDRFNNENNENRIFTAISDPFINQDCIPVIHIKNVTIA